MTTHHTLLVLAAASLMACGGAPPSPPATPAPAACPASIALPAQLQGKAVVVPKGDPDEARAALEAAVKPAGQGGICAGLAVRLTADVPVWRMWNGPAKKDASGRTNRMGGWWSYDAPHGAAQQYRTDYEICQSWNDLTTMAKCTLKKGAVVAIGPGQSVTPPTCKDANGKETTESYPVSPSAWQLYIDKVWTRASEIECPPDTDDYAADPADISRPEK
jgi:hypothetical protein